MQRLLFILFFFLTGMVCFCQTTRSTTPGFVARANQTFVTEDGILSARNGLFIPRYTDTTQANTFIFKDTLGAVIFTYDVMRLWVRTRSPKRWELVGGVAWDITGNAGTTPVTNFLGTTDAQALVFKTNSIEAMRVNASQELLVGTAIDNGAYKLQVGDNMWISGSATANTLVLTPRIQSTTGNLIIATYNNGPSVIEFKDITGNNLNSADHVLLFNNNTIGNQAGSIRLMTAKPTINQSLSTGTIIGYHFAPINTSTLSPVYAFYAESGKGYFNDKILIGSPTDISSAKLVVESTTQGLLPPRMTTAQKNAIASPATGLIVFDTDLNEYNFYNGSTWASMAGSTGANTALSNLASVAINTSLISDANNTDDLGSTSLAWKDIYSYSNKLKGPTSGEITLAAVATAGTNTITFPATTGDVVVTAGAQTIAGAKSFTNQALFSDGTTGAPGIAFSSATNFGLRFTPSSMQLVASGGDKLGVYSGGVILNSNFLTSGFTTIFNSAGVPGAGFSPNLSATTTNLLLKTGTATVAPLKFTAGTNLTTPEAGAVEFDGTNYFGTASTTRYTFAKSLTNTATLDFASTAPSTSTDLTITVTGAADGDAVTIGVPNGSTNANSCYTAFVSAANTVTIRFNNYQTVGNIDPASGTFRASVLKY